MKTEIQKAISKKASIFTLAGLLFGGAWFDAQAQVIVRGSGYVEMAVTGGCNVWISDHMESKASWTGKCDQEKYATGNGKFFRSVSDFWGKVVFVGEMRAGREFTGTRFLKGMKPTLACVPNRSSGRMTKSEVDTWFDLVETPRRKNSSHDGSGCSPNWYIEEIKLTAGKEAESVYVIGTDAERVADQTGIPAFAAYVRSFAPKKRDVQKYAEDACAKTQIVNGKKLCVE